MTLKEQIEKDFVEAYKAHEEMKVSVLRMIKSSIKNAEISAKADLEDAEVIKILRREVKQREESIESFRNGNREDLIGQNEQEIKLIAQYLPAQMDQAEVEKIVSATIAELGATSPADMGKVIGAVMKKIGPDADGGLVSAIVRKLIV